MAKIIPITEYLQYFVEDLKESYWGDALGKRGGRRRSLSGC